jgi:hypothetical protein
MDVRELRHLAEVNKDISKRIYNPDIADFTCIFQGKPYTICSFEMTEFPLYVAEHIKKHLANHLLHKRGVKNNPQSDLVEIYKEIEVTIE